MSAYSNVSYTENDEIANEMVAEPEENTSVMDEQVAKFDTNFSNEKLEALYNEYDKITLDEEKIKSLTQVKTNAVSTPVPFRTVLVMSTALLVTLLLAFLCIYNISVINSMNGGINYLQEEVISYESELFEAEGLYNRLTSTDNIQGELAQMGYEEMTSSNIVAVSIPEKVEVTSLQAPTNWFDAFCNFLSRIFG